VLFGGLVWGLEEEHNDETSSKDVLEKVVVVDRKSSLVQFGSGLPVASSIQMRLFAAATFISAVSANVTIYHRIFHPTLPVQPYLARGSFVISSDPPTFVPSPEIGDHFVSFSEVLESLQDSAEALYQVALERESDPSALWDISSVKVVRVYFYYRLSYSPLICSLKVPSESGFIRDDTSPPIW